MLSHALAGIQGARHNFSFVMAGFNAGHPRLTKLHSRKTWMRWSSPRMTAREDAHRHFTNALMRSDDVPCFSTSQIRSPIEIRSSLHQ